MDFKDSETYKNLNNAFMGELQASAKYQLFANKAGDDNLIKVADVFNETAHNEREHAEIWYKILNGGKMPSTLENLKNASGGEHYEWSQMYKKYARTARKEGYEQIARLFEGVGAIEYSHNKRYDCLIQSLEQGQMFCKPEEVIWVCTNCGSLYKGKCAPKKCPVCGYPQGYYELLNANN